MVSAPTLEVFENIAKDLMYICNNGGGEEHTHKTMSPNDNEPIVQVNDGDVNLQIRQVFGTRPFSAESLSFEVERYLPQRRKEPPTGKTILRAL